MDSNPIKLDPHCPICKMKDNEILKLKNEYSELIERHFVMSQKCIALLEEINGIPKPGSSKKPMLRVV